MQSPVQHKVRFTKEQIITANAQLDRLRPGKTIKYFEGYLYFERQGWKDRSMEINTLANKLMHLSEMGTVDLTQKRHGPYWYEYFVTMRRLVDQDRLAKMNQKARVMKRALEVAEDDELEAKGKK